MDMLKKCRKSEYKIVSNKLLEACLRKDKNTFAEIKKLRKFKVDKDNAIEGNTDNVENYFADMSENLYLYTSVDEKAEDRLIQVSVF